MCSQDNDLHRSGGEEAVTLISDYQHPPANFCVGTHPLTLSNHMPVKVLVQIKCATITLYDRAQRRGYEAWHSKFTPLRNLLLVVDEEVGPTTPSFPLPPFPCLFRSQSGIVE